MFAGVYGGARVQIEDQLTLPGPNELQAVVVCSWIFLSDEKSGRAYSERNQSRICDSLLRSVFDLAFSL